MKYYAIIVGGGSGKRMDSVLPKQFLLLKNKPILMHTIEKFSNCAYLPKIILVLHADLHEYWKELCIKYNFEIPHLLVTGGEQRFHSVRNGLKVIKENAIVAIHDAVRPLVSTQLITKAFDIAEDKGNAIPYIKPSETVRKLNKNNSKVIDREKVVLVQTPQTFESIQLKKAYQQPYSVEFTDDASVVEKNGIQIHLFEGERNNIKITYPEDLTLAKLLIE
jgi:2-C-methyl-D-erythritol 4-phosphate cytidylyltransferase